MRQRRSAIPTKRLLLRELGWEPGDRMDTILISTTTTRLHGTDDRGAIKLPATLRRLCNINYGPPLVLAAALPEQVMVVHPGIVVADMLAKHYTDLIHSERPAAAIGPELEEETS